MSKILYFLLSMLFAVQITSCKTTPVNELSENNQKEDVSNTYIQKIVGAEISFIKKVEAEKNKIYTSGSLLGKSRMVEANVVSAKVNKEISMQPTDWFKITEVKNEVGFADDGSTRAVLVIKLESLDKSADSLLGYVYMKSIDEFTEKLTVSRPQYVADFLNAFIDEITIRNLDIGGEATGTSR